MVYFIYRMTNYAAFFKHPAFQDEREYRIIISSDKYYTSKDYGGFREANGCFIPYFKIPTNWHAIPNPLKEINIGPKNNLDIANIGLEVLINELGYREVKIDRSKIPLRY